MPSPNVQRDNFHNLVNDSYDDKAFRGEYDGSNNLIYGATALPGTLTSVASWQLKKFTYTGTNLTSVTWPQISGKASFDYSFIWDNRASYTYS